MSNKFYAYQFLMHLFPQVGSETSIIRVEDGMKEWRSIRPTGFGSLMFLAATTSGRIEDIPEAQPLPLPDIVKLRPAKFWFQSPINEQFYFRRIGYYPPRDMVIMSATDYRVFELWRTTIMVRFGHLLGECPECEAIRIERDAFGQHIHRPCDVCDRKPTSAFDVFLRTDE